jgi:hypothetical protein
MRLRRHRRPQAIVPVHRLHARLHRAVVAAKERGHARRVARTPGILEQERIVQLGEHLLGEAQVLAQSHADEARTQGVPEGLPLRQVQGT